MDFMQWLAGHGAGIILCVMFAVGVAITLTCAKAGRDLLNDLGR